MGSSKDSCLDGPADDVAANVNATALTCYTYDWDEPMGCYFYFDMMR
jgi:hypothetical protein